MVIGLGQAETQAQIAQQQAVLAAAAQATPTGASFWGGLWNWLQGNNPEPTLSSSQTTASPSVIPAQGLAPAAPSNAVLATGGISTYTPEQMFSDTAANLSTTLNDFFNSIPVSGNNVIGNPCPAGQQLQDDGTCGTQFNMPWWGWGLIAFMGVYLLLEVGNSPRR